MAKKKKKSKKRPPCPDPERYTWVKLDGGGYWRLNRGTNKEAKLNSVLQANANNTRISNQAGKRVMGKLKPFTEGLTLARCPVRMAGAFKKALLKNDRLDYSALENFDFQYKDYPFKDLANGMFFAKEEKGVLSTSLQIGSLNVKRHSRLATGYFVELILLFGDPGDDRALRIDSTRSDVYSFGDERVNFDCVLQMQLPERQSWMAMLKVTCTGKYVEDASKYQAMKVIKVGHGINK